MSLFLTLLCYIVFVLVGGFLMAKVSMRIIRKPESAPVWLKWSLFPVSMNDKENPFCIMDFIMGANKFSEAVKSDHFKARSRRLQYICWTCLLLPLRIGWILLMGGFFLLRYCGSRAWQVCIVNPRNKLFIKLTNL